MYYNQFISRFEYKGIKFLIPTRVLNFKRVGLGTVLRTNIQGLEA